MFYLESKIQNYHTLATGLYLRRGHGIIFWEKEFKFENTALEWAALRPRHDNVKVSGVIVVGDGGDTGHWLLHQPLGFLIISLKLRKNGYFIDNVIKCL